MMIDEEFMTEEQFERKLCRSMYAWLSKTTGLPVDFQIQPQTHANENHPGSRNAVGLRIIKEPV